jgi:uncharacterized protein
MQTALPLQQKERLFILDAIRGVALCGILILNIYYFSRPQQAIFNLLVYEETSAWGNIAWWYLTNFLVEGSFRALFSMLFGAGAILLISRLEEKSGIGAADIYYRRLIWLLIFGLINAYVLLWPGDILYSYAVCGLFLFPLRKSSPRLLIGLAVFFVAITMFKSWQKSNDRLEMREKGLAAKSIEAKKDSLTTEQKEDLEKWNGFLEKRKVENLRKEADKEIQEMQKSYSGVWSHLQPLNNKIESSIFYNELFFDVMIFTLLGMGLYRMGVLTGNKPIWLYVIFLIVGYPIGLGTGFIEGNDWKASGYAWINYIDNRTLPFDLYQIHRLLVSLGHIGFLILLWKSNLFNWLLRLFANVGQLAFTNYLMQSVICTLIFYGYGLGYFGKVERFELTYVVVGVWIFQIIFSAIWIRFFLFGPLEWCWRSLTYWKVQPLIRKDESAELAVT